MLLDGAQSVGALEVELAGTGAAFCAFSGQKWLLGPDTTGGLYVAPEWIERLRVSAPSYYAQQGYDDRGDFDPVAGAARFDSGWLSRAALEGLLASLAFLDEVGQERFPRALELSERCRQLLASRGVELVTPAGQATLVAWRSADAAAESQQLAQRGVTVRHLPRLPWVRASVGFWTSERDLEQLAAGAGPPG